VVTVPASFPHNGAEMQAQAATEHRECPLLAPVPPHVPRLARYARHPATAVITSVCDLLAAFVSRAKLVEQLPLA
jgi:hypothetical protein